MSTSEIGADTNSEALKKPSCPLDGGSLFLTLRMRNNLIKQLGDGANSVWGIGSPVTLCLNLSVPSDLILIMGKSVLFSAPYLKPLILAYFRATEKCLIVLFVKKRPKALIYTGFRAPAS